ncbi:MAG TPA: hypothetical protein VMI73_13630 [Trebonia sp.]|nr:hypothetical protein [Trebonia sp.]
MTAVTLTIEPDALLGLNALVELSRAGDRDAGDAAAAAGTATETDAVGKAQDLLRAAIASKLDAASLPWAPSRETVLDALTRPGRSPRAARRLTENAKVRRSGLSALAVVVLVLLWGGYGDGWRWTGFAGNGQLWDWLHLLLLPVVLGTFPLWIRHREYISPARRLAYAIAIAAWIAFVVAGYLVPLNWTGFAGNTLWDWFELIIFPVALTTWKMWPSLGKTLTAYQRAAIAILTSAWIITIIGGYWLSWAWTGYSGNTLWDWLQLLLAPIVFPSIVIPTMVRWVSGDAAGQAKRDEEERKAAILTRAGSSGTATGTAAHEPAPAESL